MIPSFDKNGNLPPGIHIATVFDIQKRFAYNAPRLKLFKSFKTIVNILRKCNGKELYLNGSFVTNTVQPNDYDLCIEPTGIKPTVELREILENLAESRQKYLGDIFIRFPEPPFYFDHVIEWQKDREGNTKGIIKILIGTDDDQK